MTTWADGTTSTRLASQVEGDARKTPSGSALPSLPSNLYLAGVLFIRTTDLSLWRSNGTTWDAVIPQIDPALTRQNLLAETFPRNTAANNTAVATGVEYQVGITLKPGTTVAKLLVEATAVGTAPTLLKMALRDVTGARLAISGDASGTNNATGVKAYSMLVAYPVVTWDMYYACFLWVGGAGISLVRGLGHSIDTRAPGATYGHMGNVSAQSDIQTSATINFAGTSMLPLWIGVQ